MACCFLSFKSLQFVVILAKALLGSRGLLFLMISDNNLESTNPTPCSLVPAYIHAAPTELWCAWMFGVLYTCRPYGAKKSFRFCLASCILVPSSCALSLVAYLFLLGNSVHPGLQGLAVGYYYGLWTIDHGLPPLITDHSSLIRWSCAPALPLFLPVHPPHHQLQLHSKGRLYRIDIGIYFGA